LAIAVAGTAGAQIQRASVRSDGGQANAPSSGAATNENGSCVAFYSDASNLIPRGATGDTNAAADVFVRDLVNGVTQRVSVSSDGKQANGPSQVERFRPAVDRACTCVAFSSDATNLVPGDTNGATDIFVRDLVNNLTERVSVGFGGEQADGPSSFPSVSGDCRFVAFSSTATNLVPGDTNRAADIFVHDRATGETKRVSVVTGGVQGDAMSITPSISADGACVAFASAASTFSANDTNEKMDIYVACNGVVSCRASASSQGDEANGDSFLPSLTEHAQLVAFKSLASNLVEGDLNHAADVFVHDCGEAATTEMVSLTTRGVASDDDNFPPSISGNGRFVAFGSFASNLAEGLSTGGQSQIYVRDRQLGTTMVISRNLSGRPANGSAPDMPPSISFDGSFVAFASLGSDLVTGDTNEVMDAFIGPNATATPTRTFTPTRTPTPLPCQNSSVCPSGQVCVDNRCIASTVTPTVTATPTASVTASVTPTIQCAVTEDCPAGQVCADGICRFPTQTPTETLTPVATQTPTPTPPIPCFVDLDCPIDHICIDGECQIVPCQNDEQCPGDRQCEHGICQPLPLTPTPLPTCTTDEECTPPDRCRAGVCVPPRVCNDGDPEIDRLDCRGVRETCLDGKCECGGDCNRDGNVFGNEISIAVSILGDPETTPLSECPAADIIFPLDGEVMGNEITLAVLNLGYGCPGEGLPLELMRDRTEETRTITIGPGQGSPGGQAVVTVDVSGGDEVATTQFDLLFDSSVLSLSPLTDCALDPRLRATHTLGVFEPQRPAPPAGIRRVRFFVGDLVFPVQSFDAGPLFSCTFGIAPSAGQGTALVAGERLNIGDASGNTFGAELVPGSVDVVPCSTNAQCPDEMVCDDGVCRQQCESDDECPDDMKCHDGLCREPECSVPGDCLGAPRQTCVDGFCLCTGDCNDDGNVFGNEITLAVRILGGEDPVEVCEAADANRDGEVFSNEVTLAVINLGEGCPGQ
jgi:Tol biopolymer transport system component